MGKGIVYILTNPCLDGWVKIGRTERNGIAARIKELNQPANIPLSYRCYAIYEVEDPELVEKRIHSLIDRVDATLHARERLSNGKERVREFFRISPETAFGIFKDVAALRCDEIRLKLYQPTEEEAQAEEIVEQSTKRARNTFKRLGVPVGAEIAILFDENIKAKVVDDKNKVEYEGETYSVSALARKLLVEKQGWKETTELSGWHYFTRDGVTLSDLRESVNDRTIEE